MRGRECGGGLVGGDVEDHVGDRAVVGAGDLAAHAGGDVGVLAARFEDVADPVRSDATVVDEQVVGEFGVVGDAVGERAALTVLRRRDRRGTDR